MEYYIALPGKKRIGPFDKNELLSNGLRPDSLVWAQGMPGWLPASQVDDLKDLFVSSPPPMPQAPPVMPAATPPPMPDTITLQRKPVESKKEPKKAVANIKKQKKEAPVAGASVKASASSPTKKNDEKTAAKKDTEKKTKKSKKSKYDYPVSPWLNEAIWLLVFVLIHALIEVCSDKINYTYLYLDILGGVLSITGIIIGAKIKALNKVSYAKGSESRAKAERLAHFNGIFVSVTAAIGLLIILVQSTHFVYVS